VPRHPGQAIDVSALIEPDAGRSPFRDSVVRANAVNQQLLRAAAAAGAGVPEAP